MSKPEIDPLDLIRDPRLAPYVISAMPGWLWSLDGTRLLWANAAAAAVFADATPSELRRQQFDPDSEVADQLAQLAGSLPERGAQRIALLRGLNGEGERPLTCICSRIALSTGAAAILVAATEPVGPTLSLAERASRVFSDVGGAYAVFTPAGELVHASPEGSGQLRGASSVTAAGIAEVALQALRAGRAIGDGEAGPITLERIGTGANALLLATFQTASRTLVADEETPAEEAGRLASAAPPETEAADAACAGPAPKLSAVGETPAPPAAQETTRPAKRHPLRFVWTIDADGHFNVGSDEFVALMGTGVASALGRPWSEMSAHLMLDPEGKLERALASRDTWSGIVVSWPIDGTDQRLPVELSGLPVFDRDRVFRGYRGFGVCRDISSLTAAGQTGGLGDPSPPSPAAPPVDAPAATAPSQPAGPEPARPVLTVVPQAKNVVPFRSSAPAPERRAILTPVEHSAFEEIARALGGNEALSSDQKAKSDAPGPRDIDHSQSPQPEPRPEPLREELMPFAGERAVLDRIPLGIVVHRTQVVLYANRVLLEWTGYEDAAAITAAGGVDRLFAAPPVDAEGAGPDARPLAIITRDDRSIPVEGRLFSISWEGETALLIVLTDASEEPAVAADEREEARKVSELAIRADEERLKALELAARTAQAASRELESVLDTATDGVLVVDRDGMILASNRSAEALFGYEAHEIAHRSFIDLFAPESHRIALDYLGGLTRPGVASLLNDGRELIGRVRQGGLVPLFMTIGRIADGTDKFCVVFRDITQWKRAEEELTNAKRQAEKASSAKSDFLAKISHEIRTPLNAIIGFSEVMLEERFGPIGNERYGQYLKDIHASGGHLISLVNDLLDLSKIEAGKLDLHFTSVRLNDVVQQCVAMLQPQANRERVIIRTSLPTTLPPIVADERSMRQVAINLLSNSLQFTGAGGQVIVSTALTDRGEVVLRVRDTGVGMSEKDIATALEPFRQVGTAARSGRSGTGLGLPLTKALAEANRASFTIRSGVNAGTLVEIAFPSPRVLAE